MADFYAPRDVFALGKHYLRHLSAMTGESLHEKNDIAAELAWRDKRIEELEERLRSCEFAMGFGGGNYLEMGE